MQTGGTMRRPYGTPVHFIARSFPMLKRWANKHCAHGAGLWKLDQSESAPRGHFQGNAD